ncbi:MAG: hypothetical protein WA941_13850 [Nitrososphaeraceae archaeon]
MFRDIEKITTNLNSLLLVVDGNNQRVKNSFRTEPNGGMITDFSSHLGLSLNIGMLSLAQILSSGLEQFNSNMLL